MGGICVVEWLSYRFGYGSCGAGIKCTCRYTFGHFAFGSVTCARSLTGPGPVGKRIGMVSLDSDGGRRL